MATIDNGLIGSVMNALPLDKMISGPLQAMIQAQVTASKSYADFLMGVCIQDGKAVAIQFDYDETLTDEAGVYKGTVSKKMQIPLLAAVTALTCAAVFAGSMVADATYVLADPRVHDV